MPTYSNPVLSISVSQSTDGTELYVTETTGVYHAVTNTGGWGGGGGAVIGNTTTARLYVTNHTTGVTHTVNAFNTLPSNANAVFTIDYGDLGGTAGDVLPDVVWSVRYAISDGVIAETTYTNNPTCYILTVYNSCCCVKKLFAAISFEDCGCNSDKVVKALEAQTWLTAAQFAACSGYPERASALMEIVDRYCGGSDCGC